MVAEGEAHQIVKKYSSEGHNFVSAECVWKNSKKRPGGEIARLWAVRVIAEDGQIAEKVDINKPVQIEMEYHVLKPGYILLPHYHLINEEGLTVFSTLDVDQEWRGRPRPVGRFVCRAFIPGNLLQEGLYVVQAALITLDPVIIQFYVKDAVMFQVIDNNEGDSARGDYAGDIGGVVRPLLKWTNLFSPTDKQNSTEGRNSNNRGSHLQ
jgi:lipopolysaccharide transport system ATP-binding protein